MDSQMLGFPGFQIPGLQICRQGAGGGQDLGTRMAVAPWLMVASAQGQAGGAFSAAAALPNCKLERFQELGQDHENPISASIVWGTKIITKRAPCNRDWKERPI